MSTPLVSVVVPVFNGERHLAESLDSILAQTYPNMEVLVLDDASTDGTPDVIAAYGDRVTHIRQPSTLGIYDNTNVGIEAAKGDLVAFYHADDIYDPTIVEKEVHYLAANPEVGAVFALDILVDAVGREYDRVNLPRELRGEQPLDYETVLNALLTHKNTFLRCPTAMVPAAVYRDVGVYRQEVYRNSADLDMWLRIARRYPIAILEEHLYSYRHFHGSSSERYHHLRTDPNRSFTILDDYLTEDSDGTASPEALRAFQAHRAEDTLMRSAAHYIRDDLAEARATLSLVALRDLLGSGHVRRGRLLVLWLLMQILCRLPRSRRIADRFYQRWYARPAESRP